MTLFSSSAFAEVPIFLPPIEAEQGADATVEGNIADLPEAKFVDAPEPVAKPDVFVTPPTYISPEELLEPDSQTTPEYEFVPVAPEEQITQPLVEPGQEPAISSDSGVRKAPAEPPLDPFPDETPVPVMQQETLRAVKPVVDSADLPLVLAQFQDAAVFLSQDAVLYNKPELVCAKLGDLEKSANEIVKTPLFEVTTHFTMWLQALDGFKEAMSNLKAKCDPAKSPDEQLEPVMTAFKNLVEAR
ncbi:MAG: hypothetical protein ACWA44_13595 [Thiotrichales bacterium]